MTQTLQQLGYNEYLDRTIGLSDDPLGGAVKLDTVGSRFTGVTGFSDVIDPILLTEGAASVGKTAALESDGTIDEGMTRGQFTGVTTDRTIIPDDIVYIKPADGLVAKADRDTALLGFANASSLNTPAVAVKIGPIVRNVSTHINKQFPNGELESNRAVWVNTTVEGNPRAPGEWRSTNGSATIPPFIYGGQYHAPIGFGMVTSGGSAIYRCLQGTMTNRSINASPSLPAIGTSQDTTSNVRAGIGSEINSMVAYVYMEASDALGGNTTKRIYSYRYMFRGVTPIWHYTEVNGAGVISMGTATALTIVPSGGVNTSTLTLTILFGGSEASTEFTMRVRNQIATGLGATNGNIRFQYLYIT